MFSTHLRFANKKIQQWALNQEKISNDEGLLKLYFRPFLRWFDRMLMLLCTEFLTVISDLNLQMDYDAELIFVSKCFLPI